MKRINKKDIPYWIMIAFAVVGFALIMLSLQGCADAIFGGAYCSPPLNCIGVAGTVDYPQTLNNWYDIAYKETGPDRAGKGFVRYDIINTPQCRLGRKVQVDVPGYKRRIFTCDIGNIFAEYQIPIKQPTRIICRLLGPSNEPLEQKVVTITPDADMIRDYSEGGVEYGWRIIVTLSRQGTLRFNVSDPYWIEPRS